MEERKPTDIHTDRQSKVYCIYIFVSCSDLQEFSPEGFYNQLEEEEKELERIPDKTDITNYVKLKLGLVQSEEPRPCSPEDPEPESQSV